MATVGYGDLSPKTAIGRLVAIGLMVIGVGFFALLTGAIAQRFVATDVREVELEVEAETESLHGVLREMRAVREHLTELEARVLRLAESSESKHRGTPTSASSRTGARARPSAGGGGAQQGPR
jgi:voltage-gated potassium channel